MDFTFGQLIVLCLYGAFAYVIYKDAKKNGFSSFAAFLWGLFTLYSLGTILIYLIVRYIKNRRSKPSQNPDETNTNN